MSALLHKRRDEMKGVAMVRGRFPAFTRTAQEYRNRETSCSRGSFDDWMQNKRLNGHPDRLMIPVKGIRQLMEE